MHEAEAVHAPAWRHPRWRGGRLALLVVALSLAPALHAREIGVQEAVAQAQQQTPGKVLSAQSLRLGKRKIYRIKILTPDGQVRIVQIAAEQ